MGTDFELLHSHVAQTPGFSGPYLPKKGLLGVREMFDIANFHVKRTEALDRYLKELQSISHREVRSALAHFLKNQELIPADGKSEGNSLIVSAIPSHSGIDEGQNTRQCERAEVGLIGLQT